jgi:CubicO group peptidase (beta-lactamase class C family)
MRLELAEEALLDSMRELSRGMGMLTGLTVAYGTKDRSTALHTGLKREVRKTDAGFIPSPEPITETTVFDLASLTKLFTLLSVLQLMERGLLDGGDTIGKIDSRFIYLKDCTILDCMSYQAGLQTPQRVDAQPDAQSAEHMVFNTMCIPAEGQRLYSDMNALVLKYVVEAISGLPFFDYVKKSILSPAGMGETWAWVPASRYADLMDYNHEHRVIDGKYKVLSGALPGLPHDPKARLLGRGGMDLAGHAGLFSTAGDMCRFAAALLAGQLISLKALWSIGMNRTGYLRENGEYRQFLGLLSFSKSPLSRFSEVPQWMGERAFALAGYTGNHLAMDPELGVFDLFLGNRCHNRVSQVKPEAEAGSLGLSPEGVGEVRWPDGRRVRSSFRYIYQKDRMLHAKVLECLKARAWLNA